MNAGAINPAAIPIPHVDPEGVRHYGKALKRDGAAVADTGHDIRAAWKGLAGQYEAPEAGRLFTAIDPVETAGEDFKQAATTAGDALVAFASAADYNLQRFRNLKASAVAFNAKIADDEDWREDADLADENDLLVRAVADTALRYREQEAICANKIAALVGGTQTTPINPNTANLDGIKTPWGDATGQNKPWYLDVGDAVADFIGGSFTELGQLTGWMDDNGRLGRNGEFGFGAWWGNIRSSWGGMVEGIAGLAGLHDPKEGWGWHGLDSLGNNWKNFAHAFVPWTEWGERPGYVITTGLLNIGSIAIGGYGIVKNLPKVGRAGHRADAGPPDPLDPDRLPNGPNGIPGLPSTADIQARLKQMIDGIANDHGLERQFDKLDEKVDGLREHEPVRDREPAMAGGRDHTPDIRDHHDPSDHGPGDRDPAGPEHRPETSGEGRGSHDDTGERYEENREEGVREGDAQEGGPTDQAPSRHEEASGDPASEPPGLPSDPRGADVIEHIDESRLSRDRDGLVSHVDGKPIREYVGEVKDRQAAELRRIYESGEVSKASLGKVTGVASVVFDRHTGEIAYAINGRPDATIPYADLHPLLRARLEEMEANGPYQQYDRETGEPTKLTKYPYDDDPLRHAEIKAINELLWRRGADIGPGVFGEFRMDSEFPFFKEGPRGAPACANCQRLLEGTPSTSGRLPYPPGHPHYHVIGGE